MGAPIGVGVGVLAVLLGWLIYMGVQQDNRWDASCTHRGGFVRSHTSTNPGVGIGSGGKVVPVVTSDTTTFCLSADGRILDIR
jgi:hypothetical protein